MRQKIEDLQLLLKRDRKAQVIAGAIVFMILFLIFSPSKPQHQRASAPAPEPIRAGNMGSVEAVDDLLKSVSSDVVEVKNSLVQLSQENKEIRQEVGDFESRTAEIFKRVIERMNASEAGGGVPGAPGGVPGGANMPMDQSVEGADGMAESDDLDSFGLEQPVVAPPPPPAPGRIAFVGPGDSVRVKLLAGANAPTDGTPYPVVFKMVGDIAGPDGSSLPLGEARIIAAAQGSLTDSRVIFRLTSLNVRLPNGRRKVMPIDGWVVGEDGLRGMQGVLIDPIGKAIGAAAMAGGIEGLGEGLALAQTEQNENFYGQEETEVTGDVAKYAGGKALGGAAREWSQMIQDRVDQLVPQVQVLSGREATAVFSKSLIVPDLLDAMEDNEDPYAGLD